MDVEYFTKLMLTDEEAHALKKVLGSLNDYQFKQLCSVEGEERAMIRHIWNALPEIEDE